MSNKTTMTVQDAVSFNNASVRSAIQVIEALCSETHKNLYPDCKCEPYIDTFTFNRWVAQGLTPRKGSKSLRIASFIKAENKKNKEGETEGSLMPRMMCLFCRCQVTELKPDKV